MVELFWLLLPVAACSGWVAGLKAKSNGVKTQYNKLNYFNKQATNDLNQKYIKGLNLILHEQTDKAVDVFIDLFSVDDETVETHLALGSLFRRRGEVERALRIHQNVIARPNLSREQRLNGLLELGVDYLAAGVLDRAENIFKDFVKQDQDNFTAQDYLLDIYQLQKDWNSAINTALFISKKSHNKYFNNIAHYYCELSELSIEKGDIKEASFLTKQALKYQPNNIRANLILARLFLINQQIRKGIKTYYNIANKHLNYLDIIIPQLINSHYKYQCSLSNLVVFIENLLAHNPTILVIKEVVDLFIEQKGYDYTYQVIAEYSAKKPSLNMLLSMIELSNNTSQKTLTSCVNQLISEQKSYCCNNCGFGGNKLSWLCPSCKKWDTIYHIEFA